MKKMYCWMMVILPLTTGFTTPRRSVLRPSPTRHQAARRDLTSASWQQRGSDIEGTRGENKQGVSVALSADGTTMAFGYSTGRGYVGVYDWSESNGTWDQRGSIIEGENSGDRSGGRVALSSDGNTLAIGSRYNDGNGNNAGHVRVYDWMADESTWSQRGDNIDGEAETDHSGTVSLSSDGNTLAIGAVDNDGNGDNSGHARVFDWDVAMSEWVQRGWDIDGEEACDRLGYSVSLSSNGNTVAIGGRGENKCSETKAGLVRVYDWSNSLNNWEKRGQDIDGEAVGDWFGSVSLSSDGNTVAVGAQCHDGINGEDSGHVRVFQWNDAQHDWIQRGSDIDGEGAGDYFGHRVSLSSDGETLAVGGYFNDGENGIDSGHVRVLGWNATLNDWVQRAYDIDGKYEYEHFGQGVSLSSSGDTVAIGAHEEDFGHARVYDWYGSTPTQSPTASMTNSPTALPTAIPTASLTTASPTASPTATPTTASPTANPTAAPTTASPTASPTGSSTQSPTGEPSAAPVTPTDVPSWDIITSDNFASGFGNFTAIAGTSEVTLTGGAVCLSGKGVNSSIFHNTGHSVSAYDNLRVEVTFVFYGAENGERLMVEYSPDDGGSWNIMRRFNYGNPLENNVTYTKSVDFDTSGKSYSLTTDQAMIRIRSRINGDGKSVCISDVKFEGLLLLP